MTLSRYVEDVVVYTLYKKGTVEMILQTKTGRPKAPDCVSSGQ